MRIAVVDYGMGNLRSVSKALEHVAPQAEVLVTADPALIRSAERGSRLARWRGEAAVRVDSVFGADAPMARALLVADKSGIPGEMRERYATSGLAHMLAMSGFHMAIIALALGTAFHLLRLSQRASRIATLVVVAAYVALLGAPPGALRPVSVGV